MTEIVLRQSQGVQVILRNAGEQGPPGPQGPAGPAGPEGEPGPAGATTSDAITDATDVGRAVLTAADAAAARSAVGITGGTVAWTQNGVRIEHVSTATGGAEAFRFATNGPDDSTFKLQYFANGTLAIGWSSVGLSCNAYGVFLLTFGGQSLIGAVTSSTLGIADVNQGVQICWQYMSVSGRECAAPVFAQARRGAANLPGYDLHILPGASTGNAPGGDLVLWSQGSGVAGDAINNSAVPCAKATTRGAFEIQAPLAERQSRFQSAPVSASSTVPVASADLACAVTAGRAYRLDAELSVSAGAEGCVIGLSGPAMTAIRTQAYVTDLATGAVNAAVVTALGAVASSTGPEQLLVRVCALVCPSASGTLAVSIAQASAGAAHATLHALSVARFTEVF